MNDGANVVDVGVPLLESLRCCLVTAPGIPWAIVDIDPFDCVRLCVESPGMDDEDEKMADLGRRLPFVDGEAEAVLAKGLLRLCAVPLALKDIVVRPHEQFVVLWYRRSCTQLQVVCLRK